jgi:dTDP-4-dehydrorhamnose reductase
VDGAEDDKINAFKLNSEAVKNIVEAAKNINAKIFHFSTEYVFDGKNNNGYSEDSEVNPINVYGQSKADGEKYVLKYVQGYLIRTSWLYGYAPQRGKPRGMNFIDTMIKLSQEKTEVKVVNDQFGKPTYTKDLAQAVLELWRGNYDPGIYHLVNEGVCSWYDLAQMAFEIKAIKTTLFPISSSEYPVKAIRPKYSVLQNNNFPKLRTWQEALKEYLS